MIINSIQNKAKEYLSEYSVELIHLPKNSIADKYVHKQISSNVLIGDVKEHDLLRFENEHEEIKLYTCVGKPNLECSFIFDHPQDHYPIMLLIEMGRQMAISISHLYKNIPFEACKNTVDHLNFNVYDFIELDYPVIIGVIDKLKKNKPSIQIRELQYLFYQKGRLCCESESAVSIMTTDLYNRYRLNSRKNTTGEAGYLDAITNVALLQNQINSSSKII